MTAYKRRRRSSVNGRRPIGRPPTRRPVSGVPPTFLKRNTVQPAKTKRMYTLQNKALLKQELCEPGTLVWCPFSKHHWPAVVVEASCVGVAPPKQDNTWLLWFGSKNKVSQVKIGGLEAFTALYGRHHHDITLNKERYLATIQAIRECMRRADLASSEHEDPVKWALNGFPICRQPQSDLYKPVHGVDLFPEWLLGCMEKLQKLNQCDSDSSSSTDCDDDGDDEDSDDDDDEDDGGGSKEDLDRSDKLRERHKNRETAWAAVEANKVNIQDVCLACGDCDAKLQHPYFMGGLCISCKKLLVEAVVTCDEDGGYVYCTVCGRGGEQYMCDTATCNRVYCRRCVSLFGGESELLRVKGSKLWSCYLCCKRISMLKKEEIHEAIEQFGIQVRDTSDEDLMSFCLPVAKHSCDVRGLGGETPRKRPLRVLSLFDGIGTGLFVLNALGLEVEVYYACEIDEDALLVTSVRQANLITQLGDVRKLSYTKLKTLGRIDLLIGGSPCDELSVVNPARSGLGAGTGLLFYEFYRVLQDLHSLNSGHQPFFWLFENVASMSAESKSTISRFLECPASMWDAQHFSPQQRKRFFWGNIPALHHRFEVDTEDGDRQLKDALMPSRDAKFQKITCVTTNTNSLVRGKTEKRFPVKMGSSDDVLWIPEIERIFGFPEHYTDVGDMGRTRRQKLLGRSWSVPVIRSILRPLKLFFSTPKLPKQV